MIVANVEIKQMYIKVEIKIKPIKIIAEIVENHCFFNKIKV